MKAIDEYISLISAEKAGQTISYEDFCKVNIKQIKEFMSP